ncbi:MAG: hypothetical protein LBV33_02665 [Lachnospiraceae bacterium]|jgi:hypothetical protein|nr:hypothetical protein [Lachnospiraceae bacterium]
MKKEGGIKMSFEYPNANNLLTDRFPEMKAIYDNDVDYYIDLPYILYESEFVPYIMNRLKSNDADELKKIFDFIEELFAYGDKMIVNLVEVAVVESIYFADDYDKYKHVISGYCGERTSKSFSECVL